MEFFWIEVSAPLKIEVVFLVLGIGDRFEEVFVSHESADILGWTSYLAFKAEGIPLALGGTKASLEQDLMLPVVAEIVVIQKLKSLMFLWNDLRQSRFPRINKCPFIEVV
jgi:hypothetical protein